ncbi:MAG: hypothetical protein ACOY3D_01710, partial [Candidatus Omnitrophota bacterium]
SDQKISQLASRLLFGNETVSGRPSLPEVLWITARMRDGTVQRIEINDTKELIRAAKIQNEVINFTGKSVSQLYQIATTQGLKGFDAQAEAAKQLLVQNHLLDRQRIDLALGKIVTFGNGLILNPTDIDFDQALVLNISQNSALREKISEAMNRRMILGDFGLQRDLFRRQQHAAYEFNKYQQLRPYALLAGASATLQGSNFFADNLYSSIYMSNLQAKHNWWENQGLLDNGIARGSWMSRLHFPETNLGGREWRRTREFKKTIMANQIIEYETQRRLRELSSLEDDLRKINNRINRVSPISGTLSGRQKAVLNTELKRLQKERRGIQSKIALYNLTRDKPGYRKRILEFPDVEKIRFTVAKELSYLKGGIFSRIGASLKAFWEAQPRGKETALKLYLQGVKDGNGVLKSFARVRELRKEDYSSTGIKNRKVREPRFKVKREAFSNEWSRRKDIDLGYFFSEAAKQRTAAMTLGNSGLFDNSRININLGNQAINITAETQCKLRSAFNDIPQHLHIADLYGDKTLELRTAMHELGKELDLAIFEYDRQFASKNHTGASNIQEFLPQVYSGILNTYRNELGEALMTYEASSPVQSKYSFAGFGSQTNPFRTSYHYLSTLSSALVSVPEQVIQDNASSLKMLYGHNDRYRKALEQAVKNPQHKLFQEKIKTVQDLQRILNRFSSQDLAKLKFIEIDLALKKLADRFVSATSLSY